MKAINGERMAIDEVRTFSDKINYTRQHLLNQLFSTLEKNTKASTEKKIIVQLN